MTVVIRIRSLFGFLAEGHRVLRLLRFLFCRLLLSLMCLLPIGLIHWRSAADALCH